MASSGWPPENWYSIEGEVSSNGNIIDGVNYCYAMVTVNEQTIIANDNFPCPYFSNNYGNLTSNDALPFVGGGSDGLDGTVQIRQFEWLNFEPMERIEPIDYFYGK